MKHSPIGELSWRHCSFELQLHAVLPSCAIFSVDSNDASRLFPANNSHLHFERALIKGYNSGASFLS